MSGDFDAGLEIRTKAGLVDIRVVDADMNELARDDKATGEVVARAPWLTQGYFLNPEASEQLWTGGYLHTNDTANIRPDGYVQIADRIKDEKGGERPLALVVRNPKARTPVIEDAIKADLKLYVDRGVISKFGIPQRIHFIEQLPKTSVGKIDKKVLRQRYGDGA